MNTGENNIIVFPDFDSLQAEVEKMRTELSMLVLERDELLFVECENIRMAYDLAVGTLEYHAGELQFFALRLKRKIEMIQACRNRQEKIILSDIEKALDKEYADYISQLTEQLNQINASIERSRAQPLSREDTQEMKKLYRSIVKALHPDLHPEIADAQLELFHRAVSAYKDGDLGLLRIIDEMVSDHALPNDRESSLAMLRKEKERLTGMIHDLREEIENIKNSYPYLWKAFLEDPVQVAKRKAELEDSISRLQALIDHYQTRISDMLR